MIGPEPITRIFVMSFLRGILLISPMPYVWSMHTRRCFGTHSLLPLFHHLAKVLEEVMRIMRPRAGLRMVLDTEQRQTTVPQSLQRVVIQIHMRQLHFAFLQRIRIDCIVM